MVKKRSKVKFSVKISTKSQVTSNVEEVDTSAIQRRSSTYETRDTHMAFEIGEVYNQIWGEDDCIKPAKMAVLKSVLAKLCETGVSTARRALRRTSMTSNPRTQPHRRVSRVDVCDTSECVRLHAAVGRSMRTLCGHLI